MAFTISQMVGETKADGAKELSARGFKIFVLNPVTPVERMSTHVYSCRQEANPGTIMGSWKILVDIKNIYLVLLWKNLISIYYNSMFYGYS